MLYAPNTVFTAVVIGDRLWIVPALAVVCIAAGLLLWAYRRAVVTGWVRTTAALLKATGFVLLAACLVDPLWSGTRARPGANLFLIVVDDSASLNVEETNSKTRSEQVQSIVAGSRNSWQTRLGQDFDVRRYTLDDRLRRTDDFDDLSFEGRATSLRTSLATIERRFDGQPVAGVLLITDGLATDLNDIAWDRSDLPPIYPVVVGDEAGLVDVSIKSIAVSQTSFEDSPVTIRADVNTIGLDDTEVTAKLIDEDGQVVEEQTQTVHSDESLVFRFQLRPTQPGLTFYRVELAHEAQDATTANNSRLIPVNRGDRPHRVLYVSGRPNWEFKFLNRALADDEQIELAAMIRIAKREPKFDWRSRVDESTNPLFRGFKADPDEETERYDQPVLLRLGMKNEHELRDGFPKTEEDLFQFDAVILDDLEAEFFTHDQLELLKRFVSERGGGLLMLGGQESLGQGEYRRTPIADMLPVYLDQTAPLDGKQYRLILSREGWLEPWVRLRKTEVEELERFDGMPEFHTINRVGRVKPGATTLARAADESGQQVPALIAQRYGRGRCAVITIGDLWRWQLKRNEESDDQPKAWRQMIRWLVADVPGQFELETVARPDVTAGAMTIRLRARNEEFKPLENGSAVLTVTAPDGSTSELDAEPSLEQPGQFEALFVPRQSGPFRVTSSVSDLDGETIGQCESGWVNAPAVNEFHSVIPNRPLLTELAESTGGRVLSADELPAFAENLATDDVPITENWTFPIWHQSWVFLLALSCFAGEWGLRRWKGLP